MENKNIVIFSSGESERSGLTRRIKGQLETMGYVCMDWRGLFSCANDANSIALLPILIKKIPTFDFAVLICEGHDLTYISRGENSEVVRTMRDNVLFEIGLCAVAIGLNRTILVTNQGVHLPDDLQGANGQLALKCILLHRSFRAGVDHVDYVDTMAVCKEIDSYIRREGNKLNQVVIGAAASSACGYASNFICRLLEHIDDEIVITRGEMERRVRVSPEQVYLHVILPNNLDETILDALKKEKKEMATGSIATARDRPIQFACDFQDGKLMVVDYPTSVVTSYDTARMILEMEADDIFDEMATNRFVVKEMVMYESTLRQILNEEFVRRVIGEHYSDVSEESKEHMLQNVLCVVKNRLTITRYK